MKRNAKSRGSGGRLRLTLLLATAAALLLVPVATASANVPVHIVFVGSGSGEVKGEAGATQGTPRIECHWNGETAARTGNCDVEAGEEAGLEGVVVEHIADPGSNFGGWKILKGTNLGTCEEETPSAGACGAISFGDPELEIQATFNDTTPKFKLNLSASGSGSGSFECNTGSGPGPCAAEYKEGKVVTVTPVAAASSDFVNWTGDCSGSGSCVVTMTGEKSVGAVFNTKSLAFTASSSGGGVGAIVCKDNGSTVSCSPGSYLYGHTIKVEATPAFENELASLTGTGSAAPAGKCVLATKTCEFVIEAASTVTAEFELEARKSQAKVETVHGDVLQKTKLESACPDVDLTPGPLSFLPGVADEYHKTCNLTLTSTGTATTLTASDESSIHKGHLVQTGPPLYFLQSALEAKATDTEKAARETESGEGKEAYWGTGLGLTALSPVTLLTYNGPVSKDAVELEFNQHIGLHDPLHHGPYSKTITLTLYQTTP